MAFLLERIERIRALTNRETQIDALQELAGQIHAHPNDLFLMVDAVVKKNDQAARTLEDKYGQSLVPTLFGGSTASRILDPLPEPKIELPQHEGSKLKTPHASAYFAQPVRNTKRQFVAGNGRFEKVSELAKQLNQPAKNAEAVAQLVAQRPEAVEAAQRAGIPTNAVLRLDDALNLLLSAEGAALVRRFDDYMVASTKFHEAPLPRTDDDYQKKLPALRPKDRLAGELSAYYFFRRMEGTLREGMTEAARRAVMPHAIVSALAGAATEDGLVPVGLLLSKLGDAATPLIKELSVALEHGAKDTMSTRKGAKFRYLPEPVATLVTRSARTLDLDQRMAGFWAIVDAFGSPTAMKDVIIGRSGHLVNASDAFSRALMASGAIPGFQRGKHYSADPESIHRDKERGWTTPLVYQEDHDYQLQDSLHPDLAFWSGVISAFDRREGSMERILLFDDGFSMLKALHELNADGRIPKDVLSRIAAVEQTEKGALTCEKMEAEGVPLVVSPTNMPRSWLKKMVEGPAIGECIAWHIERMLLESSADLKVEPKEAAVVGYGAVGRATAAALKRRGYRVHVYDHDPRAMLAAKDAGFDVGGLSLGQIEAAVANRDGLDAEGKKAFEEARKRVFSHGHLAVDCTPGPGWDRSELELFPDHSIMANGGSGTLWQASKPEPAAWEEVGINNRRQAHQEGKNIDGGAQETALSSLIGYREPLEARDLPSIDPKESIDDQGLRRATFKGKQIVTGDLAARDANGHEVVRGDDGSERLILYGGSVVNLKYGLPPEYLQITHSLLYVSGILALQHIDRDPPRWIEIPDAVQRKMKDILEAHLRSRGISLSEPDFDKTPPLTG